MRRWITHVVMASSLALLAACETVPGFNLGTPSDVGPPLSSGLPETRPPSEASAALALYYQRLQNDLLVQGLLRTDGGGPDTPYSDTMLARNFEQIAFFDEYAQGAGFSQSDGTAGTLKRWAAPVRFNLEFGPGVTPGEQHQDRASVSSYARRLARATGHPIGLSRSSANFHVLFMGEDDAELIEERVRSLVPGITPKVLSVFTNLPREVYCLVVAFSSAPGTSTYGSAVALIRAEQSGLMRRACIHEELAQGLGLANDSPAARPSIFNDDEEFALLTTHDAHLLAMLYDQRFTPGMSLDAARPLIRQIAKDRLEPTG